MLEALVDFTVTGTMGEDSPDTVFIEVWAYTDSWTDMGTVTTMGMATGTGSHPATMNARSSVNV
jgi:hypothetical protein